MELPSDIRVVDASLWFLPVHTRMPLKFGAETLTSVTCARVRLRVRRRDGREAEGWGETPLSVQWVWPSPLPWRDRHDALCSFTRRLARAWTGFDSTGHAFEIGCDFQSAVLPEVLREWNRNEPTDRQVPWLAALVCASAFDLALHDAWGVVNDRPVWTSYSAPWIRRDLSHFLTPATDRAHDVSFRNQFPADYLLPEPRRNLLVWHLVGGLDPLGPEDQPVEDPEDGHPVLLRDWIARDGLKALKIKLRGNDPDWDFERLVRIGRIAREADVWWLSADFNGTVTDPEVVTGILDRLRDEHPATFGRLLYVEQPFPTELEDRPIDVRSVSARLPLFLDESAHDWRNVRFGRSLGWTGVALKTCKTQSGALLSLAWARAHGMTLMVQDLTNPMLAQIPHVLLATHAGTIAGVESNSMQFYPAASMPEAEVHPGLFTRREGRLDLGSIRGPGFGYRIAEIRRTLPPEEPT